MNDIDRRYWLFKALKGEPGFAYRPDGHFEYWGVPLEEIPASVFDPREAWVACYPRSRHDVSRGDLYRLADRVDEWLATR